MTSKLSTAILAGAFIGSALVAGPASAQSATVAPTATPTATVTETAAPTATVAPTATATETVAPTATATATETVAPSATATATATETAAPSESAPAAEGFVFTVGDDYKVGLSEIDALKDVDVTKAQLLTLDGQGAPADEVTVDEGVFTIANGVVTFTPEDEDFVGDVEFFYTVTDNEGTTHTGAVPVTIEADTAEAEESANPVVKTGEDSDLGALLALGGLGAVAAGGIVAARARKK